jgi:hypothetical protein
VQVSRGADGLICQAIDLGVLRFVQILTVQRVVEVILSFDKRCARVFEIACKIGAPKTAESLGDGTTASAGGMRI